MSKQVRLSELRDLSLDFPGDLFVLAAWILATDMAWSARNTGTRRRTTMHGLANKYAILTGESINKVHSHLVRAGLSLEATLEPDDNQSPEQTLRLISES